MSKGNPKLRMQETPNCECRKNAYWISGYDEKEPQIANSSCTENKKKGTPNYE
jgi:hypothetical protein